MLTHQALSESNGSGWLPGLSFRRTQPGPESDLVDLFLAGLPRNEPPHCLTTIFREPKLMSGFPDIVAVTWHVPTAKAWSKARQHLKALDIRLLHLLVSSGPTDEETLTRWLVRSPRTSLSALEAAGLARSNADGLWSANEVSDSFAVRKIVSFEAKISDWRGAIEQASLNLWFASESYVVLPRLPKSESAVLDAAALGVGVWIAGEAAPTRSTCSFRQAQPVSFASWLFNEWVWQAAF